MPGEDRRMRQRAHPRSRGENVAFSRSQVTVYGSSPLTRGKLYRPRARRRERRLIPAHAGKTVCGSCRFATMSAHPRSRGENALAAGQAKAAYGSSPLTRGKPGS